MPVFRSILCFRTVFAKGIDGFDEISGICRNLCLEPVGAAIPLFIDDLSLDDPCSERGNMVFRELEVFNLCFTFQVDSQFLQKKPLHLPEGNSPA